MWLLAAIVDSAVLHVCVCRKGRMYIEDKEGWKEISAGQVSTEL